MNCDAQHANKKDYNLLSSSENACSTLHVKEICILVKQCKKKTEISKILMS